MVDCVVGGLGEEGVELEVVHECCGLEDSVVETAFDEVLFDVALAVVVEEFAELGIEDGGVDEVG